MTALSAELRGLTVQIKARRWQETVLDAVDLVVQDGKITALLGESGCGKSMAAAALTGNLPDTARVRGQVFIDGEKIGDRRQWIRLRRAAVGYLPQAGVTAFLSDETVGEQFHALQVRFPGSSVDEACAAAGYPTELGELRPSQHSGGQIQRAALAAALLPRPGVLIADEPTASLDIDTAYTVWVTLRRYADAGAAVLVITHDIPMLTATRVADHVALMRHGKITATGPLSTLAAADDPYTRGFFATPTPP